eukprot:13155787-Ditylum_brightwellii.AAC.1
MDVEVVLVDMKGLLVLDDDASMKGVASAPMDMMHIFDTDAQSAHAMTTCSTMQIQQDIKHKLASE